VRLGRQAGARSLTLAVGFSSALASSALASSALACGAGNARDVTVTMTIEPAAPVQNSVVQVLVDVRATSGGPLDGASLQLEAHMTHPGMAPVVAPLAARGDGVYAAPLELTMAGPWVVVASGTLADGRRVSATHDLNVGPHDEGGRPHGEDMRPTP
jgi:hypothetical protein